MCVCFCARCVFFSSTSCFLSLIYLNELVRVYLLARLILKRLQITTHNILFNVSMCLCVYVRSLFFNKVKFLDFSCICSLVFV